MSEMPPSGPSHGQSASGFPGAPASMGQYSVPTAAPSRPVGSSQPSRWPTYATLVIALIATGLAIIGWFRPTPVTPTASPSTSPTYGEQQISDAKSHACNAFETVQKGVKLQTNEAASADPATRKAQATAGQLSVVAGGWYLKDHLEPALPATIKSAVQHLADLLLDLGANYIAGEHDSDPVQGALRTDTVSAFGQVHDLCK